MRDTITAFLSTSPHTCLLLVHPEVRRLEDEAQELVAAYGWPCLAVGRELSARLLSEPQVQRSRTAHQWLRDRLSQMAPGPVLCTEIDLLFDPTLRLAPLKLLRDISRYTQLVVAWPGSCANGVLVYAVPEHAHYRTWRQPDVSIICL